MCASHARGTNRTVECLTCLTRIYAQREVEFGTVKTELESKQICGSRIERNNLTEVAVSSYCLF